MKDVLTFASGSNAGQEIMGFAEVQMAPGVAVPGLRSNAMPTLEGDFLSTPYPLFLDSGAVSEVEFRPDGPPVVVDPISHDDWLRRLDVYRHLGLLYGKRLYAVAPDCVGSQVTTLERLTVYRDRVRELVGMGVNVMIVLQGGELSRHDFFLQCLSVLDLGPHQVVVAFPMRQGCTDLAEIALFLNHHKPSKLHLLGMGHTNNQFGDTIDLIQEHSPDTMISNDAVLLRGIVGYYTTDGQKDPERPKLFTKSQLDIEDWFLDTCRSEPPNVELFGEQVRGDYTDCIAEPSYWMKPTWIKTDFPKMARLNPQETKVWRADPDSFLQSEDPESGLSYIEIPDVEYTLEHFWLQHHYDVTCQEKKRMAIVDTFGPGSKYWAPVPDSYFNQFVVEEDSMQVTVITSCTGQKAATHDNQLTLEDFQQGADHIRQREVDLDDSLMPAEELYTGQQHTRLMRGVNALRASGVSVRVYIMSAGYGLVEGSRRLAPYNASFVGMKTKELQGWAKTLGIPQDVREALSQPSDLNFVLLGESYLKACDLGQEMTLGGDTVAYCTKGTAPKLENLGIRAYPLANAEAKEYGCGLVGLKGELTARMLLKLADAPEIETIKELFKCSEQPMAEKDKDEVVDPTPQISWDLTGLDNEDLLEALSAREAEGNASNCLPDPEGTLDEHDGHPRVLTPEERKQFKKGKISYTARITVKVEVEGGKKLPERRDKDVTVEAYVGMGLAIHKAYQSFGWQIRHIQSLSSVVGNIRTRENALEVAHFLTRRRNWDCPGDDIAHSPERDELIRWLQKQEFRNVDRQAEKLEKALMAEAKAKAAFVEKLRKRLSYSEPSFDLVDGDFVDNDSILTPEDFQLLIHRLQTIASKEETRAFLRVAEVKDGYAYATDGHRAVKIAVGSRISADDLPPNGLLALFEDSDLKGEFPDVESVIPPSGSSYQVIIDAQSCVELVKVVRATNKVSMLANNSYRDPTVAFHYENGEVFLRGSDDDGTEYVVYGEVTGGKPKEGRLITFDGTFLVDALTTATACPKKPGTFSTKCLDGTVQIQITDRLCPLRIDRNDTELHVIMPCRF